jgi:hypothetical protein
LRAITVLAAASIAACVRLPRRVGKCSRGPLVTVARPFVGRCPELNLMLDSDYDLDQGWEG